MKNEEFKNKKIGIIGGLGAMGTWFNRYFTEKGFKVEVSDLETEITNKDIAENSDIIILSTPMGEAGKIVKEVGSFISEDKLIMDLCSLKSDIVESMKKHTKCQVMGCHPMFGQYTKDLNGQNIILCRGRGEDFIAPFKELFEGDHASVTIGDPKEHDKYMALVQGVTHLITIATGEFLKRENIKPEEIKKYSTPVFSINLALIGRLFGLDISLYKDLVGKNKNTEEMVKSFIESTKDSLEILTADNEDLKLDHLKSIKNFMGEYSQSALKETNAVFDFMYK